MNTKNSLILFAAIAIINVSILVASFAQELTLEEALDCPNVVWLYGGDAPWMAIRSPSHDGIDAARSGLIIDDQTSAIGTYFVGPGKLSFWWKVSSEMNADILRFYLNGYLIDAISGNLDWTYKELQLPAGLNIVVWEYSKDGTLSEGLDAGFLDEVKFIPDNPQPAQPKLEISSTGSAIILSWQSQSTRFILEETDDLAAGWRRSNISIATNQNMAIAIVTNLSEKKFFRLKSE